MAVEVAAVVVERNHPGENEAEEEAGAVELGVDR